MSRSAVRIEAFPEEYQEITVDDLLGWGCHREVIDRLESVLMTNRFDLSLGTFVEIWKGLDEPEYLHFMEILYKVGLGCQTEWHHHGIYEVVLPGKKAGVICKKCTFARVVFLGDGWQFEGCRFTDCLWEFPPKTRECTVDGQSYYPGYGTYPEGAIWLNLLGWQCRDNRQTLVLERLQLMQPRTTVR